jgi:cysteinyl-tRNA synthetase
MDLHFHNTLTRKKERFEPLDPKNLRVYVCHIGNARPLIVFDVLFRLLRTSIPDQVTYVRNITDVDDKIIAQAKENGEPIEALTERTTEAFEADAAALGCLEPTLEPKATQHIGRWWR